MGGMGGAMDVAVGVGGVVGVVGMSMGAVGRGEGVLMGAVVATKTATTTTTTTKTGIMEEMVVTEATVGGRVVRAGVRGVAGRGRTTTTTTNNKNNKNNDSTNITINNTNHIHTTTSNPPCWTTPPACSWCWQRVRAPYGGP